MGEYDSMMSQWVKERDEAALSFDVEKFKAFFQKWRTLGIYQGYLPNDNIIEISMRKMVLALANPPKDKLEEAKAWLKERGYAPEF